MGKSAGRFEKRYILESLSPDGPSLVFERGGKKSEAILGNVEAEAFTLVPRVQPFDASSDPEYRLDIAFRGLVFRSSGSVLGAGPSSARISLLDPWRIISVPSPPPGASRPLPAVFLAVGDRRFEAAWRHGPIGSPESPLPSPALPLARLAGAMDAEAEFFPFRADTALGLQERILSSGGKRLIVLDPPLGIPDDPVSGFSFLTRREFMDLCALDRGDSEESRDMDRAFADSQKPGIHSPVFIDSKCLGILYFRPRRSSFTSIEAADPMHCLLLENIAAGLPPILPGSDGVSCLSLQAESAAFLAPPDSPLSSLMPGQKLRIHVSYPGREIGFLSRLDANVDAKAGRLALVSFENGKLEDFRFLFESLYGHALDGIMADYLIKKAAP